MSATAPITWSLKENKDLKCADGGGLAKFYGNAGQSIDKLCIKCGNSNTDMGCLVGLGGGAPFEIADPLYNVTYHNQKWNDTPLNEFIRFMDKGKAADVNFGAGKLGDIQKAESCPNGFNGFNVDIYTSSAGANKLNNFKPLCATYKDNLVQSAAPEKPAPAAPAIRTYGDDTNSLQILELDNLATENYEEVEVLTITNNVTVRVNKDTEASGTNVLYTAPLINNNLQMIISSDYTEGAVVEKQEFNSNKFKPEDMRDLVSNKASIINSKVLSSNVVRLPIEQSLLGDIVTKLYIPVVENDVDTVKEVGITSTGKVVSISYRNLYILLLVILVIVLVMVMRMNRNNNMNNMNNMNRM